MILFRSGNLRIKSDVLKINIFLIQMELFFLRSKLYFLLQSIEIYLAQIANSDRRDDFVVYSENFISTIYRATRDFTETFFTCNFSIHDIQYSDRTVETIKALGELNNLLITWMEFKNQRAARGQPFWNISEEQRFINHMHTIANRLIRFQADFER